jgi:hypothetical protein
MPKPLFTKGPDGSPGLCIFDRFRDYLMLLAERSAAGALAAKEHDPEWHALEG